MPDTPYPPNSKNIGKPAEPAPEDKGVERVTSEEPIRRKKSVGKQFKDVFAGGNLRTASHSAFFGVMVPAAQEMLVDAGRDALEKLIFGESRKRPRQPGPNGYVSYNRFSKPDDRPPMPSRNISKRARSTHDFDEIVLVQRAEAETVIDRLFDLISRYEQASVADLYELVGIKGTHTDNRWGWTDLRGAGVARVRNGFLLDLPEPEPLD